MGGTGAGFTGKIYYNGDLLYDGEVFWDWDDDDENQIRISLSVPKPEEF